MCVHFSSLRALDLEDITFCISQEHRALDWWIFLHFTGALDWIGAFILDIASRMRLEFDISSITAFCVATPAK